MDDARTRVRMKLEKELEQVSRWITSLRTESRPQVTRARRRGGANRGPRVRNGPRGQRPCRILRVGALPTSFHHHQERCCQP